MLGTSTSNGYQPTASRIQRAFAFVTFFAYFAVPTAAQADSAPQTSYRIQVPVVAVDPVVEERRVTRPERHCGPVSNPAGSYSRSYNYDRNDYDEYYRPPQRRSRRENNLGAQILGGLIGGAIGNQFGKGNGRKALTIAGALVGSSVARDRNSQRNHQERRYRNDYEPEYRCRTTRRERTIEEIIGYDVTYEYNGTTAVKRMGFDPGDTLELRVTASPVLTNSARRTL
jgi:uncharacterized protein YcfJ